MLTNSKGEKVTLGPGCVIGFYKETREIVLVQKSGDGTRIRWSSGDDKLIGPNCIRSEHDFFEVALLIANCLGLRIVEDDFKRTYGPAYRFVE